jgi:hypothetical protein
MFNKKKLTSGLKIHLIKQRKKKDINLENDRNKPSYIV